MKFKLDTSRMQAYRFTVTPICMVYSCFVIIATTIIITGFIIIIKLFCSEGSENFEESIDMQVNKSY